MLPGEGLLGALAFIAVLLPSLGVVDFGLRFWRCDEKSENFEVVSRTGRKRNGSEMLEAVSDASGCLASVQAYATDGGGGMGE